MKPQDVFKALENVGLGAFTAQVQQDLESYEAYRNDRRNKSENGNVAKTNADDISDDEETAANLDGSADNGESSKKIKVGDADKSGDEDVTMNEAAGNDTTEIIEDDDQEEEEPTGLGDETNDDTIEIEDSVDDLGNANENDSEDEDEDEETANFRNK